MDEELHKHQLEEERRLSDIEEQLSTISSELTNVKNNIKDLVAAWQAASWIVSIVKGIGALAVAIGAAYALFTGHK